MSAYQDLLTALPRQPRRWLITGVAGFIGSHLLETLLSLDQRVTGLDDFSTGHARNLDHVQSQVTAAQWARFQLRRGDIRDAAACHDACAGVEFVLHEAALGSVPRSLAEPENTHAINVTGFLNLLVAARDAGMKRFVYASSSAVYGDHPGLPKTEEQIGQPLSPYAASKMMNELYADTFARCYGLETVGLRYFNVFGARQDPQGAYAAVIPKWIAALLRREPVNIHGDGETSRDFCHVANVVQANLLAATTTNDAALNQVYNVALGQRTTLNELFAVIQTAVRQRKPELPEIQPQHDEFRAGDIRHSLASIQRAQERLGYAPTLGLTDGLERAMDWYCQNLG